MSTKRPNVYKELIFEYASALKHLTNYLRHKSNSKVDLKVFTPEQYLDLRELHLEPIYVTVNSQTVCRNILQKLLKFFKVFLHEWFLFYTFDDRVFEILDDLEYIMSCCDVCLKISVVEVFVNYVYNVRDDFPQRVLEKCSRFCSLFELFTYDVYNNRVTVDKAQLESFEGFLVQFLESNDFKNKDRICDFVFKKTITERNNFEMIPSKYVLDVCLSSTNKINTDEINFNEVITLFFEKYEFSCVGILQKQIVEEFEDFCTKKVVIKEGALLSKVFFNFERVLRENKDRILKDVNKYLELICAAIDLFVKVGVLLKRKITQTASDIREINRENSKFLAVFGERFEFFEIFLRCVQYPDVSSDVLLKAMAKSAAFSKLNDLLAVADVIAYSIFQKPSRGRCEKFYGILGGCKCVRGLEAFHRFLCYVSTDLCVEKDENYQLKEKCICVVQTIGRQCLNEETANLVSFLFII